MAETDCYLLTLTLEREQADALSLGLSELLWPPADAVAMTDREDGSWQLQAYFSELPDKDTLHELLRAHGVSAPPALSRVEKQDWVAESQSRLHPVQAGRFLVHGSHDRSRLPPGRHRIQIDAAQAFGTAHHGSTLGCLIAIDRLAKHARFSRILDLGTGSGILSVAAARVWPAHILASDIDPVAVSVARDNIALNGAGFRMRAVTAEGLSHPAIRARIPFDLVIANILARPLCAIAHDIAHAVCRGGFVILSGITRAQAKRVTATYRVAGFTRISAFPNITQGDWETLVLKKTG